MASGDRDISIITICRCRHRRDRRGRLSERCDARPRSDRGLLLTLFFRSFSPVAANAIATTARNPVSGMTMLTIIVSSVVLLRFGLSGTTGMFFVMAIAGMVCTRCRSRDRPSPISRPATGSDPRPRRRNA
jgi:hypothetical protein